MAEQSVNNVLEDSTSLRERLNFGQSAPKTRNERKSDGIPYREPKNRLFLTPMNFAALGQAVQEVKPPIRYTASKLADRQNRKCTEVDDSIQQSRTDAVSGVTSTVVTGSSSTITVIDLKQQGIAAHKSLSESRKIATSLASDDRLKLSMCR